MAHAFDPIVRDLVPILYRDRDLVAVTKPAGIDTGRLAGFESAGLTELLPRVYPDEDFGEPVNRLSRFESGVVVFCRHDEARERLRAAWNAGKVRQEIIAVVRGRMKGPSLVLSGAEGPEPDKPARRGAAVAAHRQARKGRSRSRAPLARPRAAAPSAASGAIHVRRLHAGTQRLVISCRTSLKSTHALKAALRGASLHVLGDTRGGPRGLRDRPERTCLHLHSVRLEHPVTRKPVVLVAPDPPGFPDVADGAEPLERILFKSLARRIECLLDDTTDAFRVLSGDAEGLPGVNVDKFGDVLVLHLLDGKNPPNRGTRMALARTCLRTFGAVAVYQKIAPKDRSYLTADEAEQLLTDRPLAGRPVDPIVTIRERGLVFETHPLDPLAVGLYLDHRENRARIRAMAEGRNVLNLFAYTCGFSVAAAAGGARSVVSVDQARRALAWGRLNFVHNGLLPREAVRPFAEPPAVEGGPDDPSPLDALEEESTTGDDAPAIQARPEDAVPSPDSRYAFYADEVFDFLRRADRKARKFDLIILDPPTFARMKKPNRTFHIAKDLPELVRETLPLLARGGTLFVATNFREMSASRLLDLIRAGAGSRRLSVLKTPPLPPDFAADPHHHKAIFLRADA